MKCPECRFSEVVILDDGPNVECHRFPPVIIGVNDEPLQVWPQVQSEDWCGEFQSKEGSGL